MPRITAMEAEQIVKADLEGQRRRNQANLPSTPQLMNDLTGKGVIRICNVGPWPYHIERGAKYLDIPAYDKANDPQNLGCAMSVPQPMVCQEAKIVGGGGEVPLEYSYIFDDGKFVAKELIGIGHGLPAHNSLVQYGVFVSEGPLPTKEEIAAAREQLNLYAERLIQEARQAFDQGRESWNQTRSDRHLWAGRLKGVQEKWVSENHQEESVKCDMCGKFNPAGIAKCACGNIVDFELFAKISKRQSDMLERVEWNKPRI